MYQLTQLIFTANFHYTPNKETTFFLAKKVMPLVYEKQKDIFLNFVGIHPIEDLKGENFIFTGRVDDIRTYLEASLFYVVPLFSGGGIKNKILEAMSMGKIIIGSKLSFDGINGEDKKHFLIVEGNSPDTWANFILDAVANSEKYLPIKNNARQLIAEHYSWQFIHAKYKELYIQFMNASNTNLHL